MLSVVVEHELMGAVSDDCRLDEQAVAMSIAGCQPCVEAVRFVDGEQVRFACSEEATKEVVGRGRTEVVEEGVDDVRPVRRDPPSLAWSVSNRSVSTPGRLCSARSLPASAVRSASSRRVVLARSSTVTIGRARVDCVALACWLSLSGE